MAQVSVIATTVGSNGSATVTVYTPAIDGVLMSIKVAYSSQPATTDVTISESGGLGRTILTLTNTNTTGTYNPVVALHDGTGTAIAGQYRPYTLSGVALSVLVAQGDSARTVTVTVDYIPNYDSQ
jgi:hypothetical protein